MADRNQLDQVELFVSNLIRTLTAESGAAEGQSGKATLFPSGVRSVFAKITTGDVHIELALSSSSAISGSTGSPPTNGVILSAPLPDELVKPGHGPHP